MKNPLLDFSTLPRYEEIRNEHITPAMDELLRDCRAVVNRVKNATESPDWQDFVQPVVDANERLSRAWGQIAHLNAVMNNPELREIYNANLPRITQYYAELSQDPVLFEKFRQLRADPAFNDLSQARRKIVDNQLRDFHLGGAELPLEDKARFMQIQEELSALSSKFNDNLLDATNAFSLFIENRDELAGIPEDVLQAAREAATKDTSITVPGWKFTLHAPSYLPVMQYADNRSLRERMYRAYVTRASELEAVPEQTVNRDNMPLIEKMLRLRQEEARLLSYDCYAQVSLTPKMAETPQQVLDFLNELAAKARPYAERDLAELQQFAADKLKLDRLEMWDIAYASEKLRIERYAFSEQEVKQYFPENKVLPGMFRLVETLYGIRISEAEPARNIQCWHPDVKFFDIADANGNLLGQFYLDLYARPGKRGGAWMDDAITRRKIEVPEIGRSEIQAPVAYLTCNFSAPVTIDGQLRPALFTHDEVITLFHEFGHGLHHLLTRMDELGVSGINGVEWDAVELPSQFMENFCWEWEVLRGMTAHVETGNPLPRALFDKMLAAKNFQSGLQTLRQIEFALFDMHLHTDFDPQGSETVLQRLDKIRQRVAVIIPPAFNRFPDSFGHIFAGGYAAGYYSYKWAEVLSADAYSLFEENGAGQVVSAKTGERFWHEILAVGGSRPALESFIAFRGREPKIDALLRHHGMAA
ncbi:MULTISPECIES: M3 family metallopeptidase [Nitrosomonas]|uniref:oligopeptidase A n=1 Tax=Nitrosomonas europaea (strain ATCC 19718 / CIP 103999 / KCTC 2705 / NBRC 14298) TaxID=228410 RepID=Q82U45_NITEU|nr:MULTISPECIES: M3 family metallopeptidase [Nitrosomonas]CAD85574.1 Peptidase family M3 [Nitrosomonas europaea ATCC 19718]SDW48894.1 oligopeptidase A Metallo peptidase. MEROPS family M03A [Nitrosomonas europaea]SET10997.1 oligopeptidase A Metallo peptidase. MEROPS family M03A [Nitrosomonas europaea]SJZ62050.1 oligopeptidase A Metallo peptidase. MEROPS family M03A [Nitrosomonas europaea]HBF24573.1 M3 family peptidase [Nitrosomonas sp.]